MSIPHQRGPTTQLLLISLRPTVDTSVHVSYTSALEGALDWIELYNCACTSDVTRGWVSLKKFGKVEFLRLQSSEFGDIGTPGLLLHASLYRQVIPQEHFALRRVPARLKEKRYGADRYGQAAH